MYINDRNEGIGFFSYSRDMSAFLGTAARGKTPNGQRGIGSRARRALLAASLGRMGDRCEGIYVRG